MSPVTFASPGRTLHGEIRLHGFDVDVMVGDGLVSFDEELTIDGSPIVRIGVLDPKRVLIGSELMDLERDDDEVFRREVELTVDGVAYWLRQVSKQGDVFELTFEDLAVCLLRDGRGATKMSPDTIDHRSFVASLCRWAGAPAPIMRVPGPRERLARKRAGIGKTRIAAQEEAEERDDELEPGFADGVRLRAKGAVMNAEQLANAARVMAESRRIGAGPKATLAAAMAGIVENVWSNSGVINDPGSTSVGIFQAQYGLSEGINDKVITREEALDIEYMTRCFHEDRAGGGFASKGGAMYLERAKPWMNAGQIAQAVEASAYPERYGQHEAEARAIVEAYNGGTAALSSGVTTTTTREAALTVERDESYWDAARRIAESYNARFFVVANQPYYLFDEALMRSRGRMTIGEDTPGVDAIDWEWAPRKQLRETEVLCNVAAWQAPPGSVVLLDEDCGPAAGRWLVGDYERSRFETRARITLIKGRKPTVPVETQTTTSRAASSDGSVRTGSGRTTSPFGGAGRYPITDTYNKQRATRVHKGLDIGVPCGTPCIAPFDGLVTYATPSGFGTAGGMIHLQSPVDIPEIGVKAGDKLGWGHISAAQARVGQRVTAGTRIATSGGSPCHVHMVLLRGPGGNGVDGNADPTPIVRALGGLS